MIASILDEKFNKSQFFDIKVHKNNLLLTSTNQHQILLCEMTNQNKILDTISYGTYGQQKEQLNAPRGIDLMPEAGLIFIVDSGNHRIKILTCNKINNSGDIKRKEEEYLSVLNINHSDLEAESNYFDDETVRQEPEEASFDPFAEYEVDIASLSKPVLQHNHRTGNQTFLEFDCFGHFGFAPDCFNSPSGIAIAGNRILIADTLNHQIKVWEYEYFDKKSKFLMAIGTCGSASNQFSEPTGICVTKKFLLVSDRGNSRIQILSPGNYNFLSQISLPGSLLCGIAPISHNTFCIVDQVQRKCFEVRVEKEVANIVTTHSFSQMENSNSMSQPPSRTKQQLIKFASFLSVAVLFISLVIVVHYLFTCRCYYH